MNSKILILSPHTDDAELGCGGSIINYLEQKKEIFWVVFSTAEESLPKDMPENTLKIEFLDVAKKLSLKSSEVMVNNFKVRYLHEKRQEVLELLVKIRQDFNPDLVIGPSLNDFHQDHSVVANEMVRAFKSTSSIISYELPWNHVNFNTQFFTRLTKIQIEKKIDLLTSYKSQVQKNRAYFSGEFIEGLARTRGIQVNTEFAEAFEVIRWIE
jgi:LmbE family N-acetylglucosaminyl deacetylase